MTNETSDPRIRTIDAPRISRPNRRGRPFAKGNPGRPKGARNKLTIMREALTDQRADAVVQLAIAGNRLATVAVMEQLLGPAVPPTVAEFTEPLPSAHHAAAAMQTVLRLVCEGALGPAEGLRLTRQINRGWRRSRKAQVARMLAVVEGSSAAARASRDTTAHATDAAPPSPPAPTR